MRRRAPKHSDSVRGSYAEALAEGRKYDINAMTDHVDYQTQLQKALDMVRRHGLHGGDTTLARAYIEVCIELLAKREGEAGG